MGSSAKLFVLIAILLPLSSRAQSELPEIPAADIPAFVDKLETDQQVRRKQLEAPRTNCLGSGDEKQLLQRVSAGALEIPLCPKAVIKLKKPIVFTKPGQKIFTSGLPLGDERATLILSSAEAGFAIESYQPKTEVRNIIVDGNRRSLGYLPPKTVGQALIQLGGEVSGVVVDGVKAGDTRTWSTIALHGGAGHDKGAGCTGAILSNNEIGPAGTSDERWADGISLACRTSVVKNNLIYDTTDGAIVVFGSPGSVILRNVIEQSNDRLLGAIAMVDYAAFNGDFTDTAVLGNLIHGKGGRIAVGIAFGPPVWFGCDSPLSRGKGGIIKYNHITGKKIGYGIAVNGVSDAVVLENRSSAEYSGSPNPSCGLGNASPGPFLISKANSLGSFQPEFREGVLSNIIYIGEGPTVASSSATAGAAEVAGAEEKKKSSSETWLDQVFVSLLGRPTDPVGAEYFQRMLGEKKATQEEIRKSIAMSQEARNKINEIYQKHLGRDGDQAGLDHFQKLMAQGGDLAAVEAAILSSAEYMTKSFRAGKH